MGILKYSFMATIRSEKKAEIEKILAAKERKKLREEAKKG